MKTWWITMVTVALSTVAMSSGFVKNPKNGHYYKAVYVPDGISWSSAKAEAEKAGGYLATITSEKESRFIRQLVDREELWVPYNASENLGPWIGGYQKKGAREPAGGWAWVTGEDFSYVNWAPNEPSGRWSGRNENRLHLYSVKATTRSEQWNDLVNSPRGVIICGYIVEKGDVETETADQVLTEPLGGYHDFLGADGKSCRARVMDFDPETDTVTLAKGRGKKYTVPLSRFSQPDQTYIHEWHLANVFCTPKNLQVSIRKRQIGNDRKLSIKDSRGILRGERVQKSFGYTISLKNTSATPLNNISVDYCIFYEQERPAPNGKVAESGVEFGSIPIATLDGKAERLVETEAVALLKFDKYEDTHDGEIHGIWIRVYLPLPTGKKAMQEYCRPDYISRDKRWTPSDIDIEF